MLLSMVKKWCYLLKTQAFTCRIIHPFLPPRLLQVINDSVTVCGWSVTKMSANICPITNLHIGSDNIWCYWQNFRWPRVQKFGPGPWNLPAPTCTKETQLWKSLRKNLKFVRDAKTWAKVVRVAVVWVCWTAREASSTKPVWKPPIWIWNPAKYCKVISGLISLQQNQ